MVACCLSALDEVLVACTVNTSKRFGVANDLGPPPGSSMSSCPVACSLSTRDEMLVAWSVDQLGLDMAIVYGCDYSSDSIVIR
jgi:hypothetical protein